MIKSKELSNKIKIVYEQLEHFKSVGIAVWVKTGSSCETQQENGISHFVEHMLFKGTEKRSAKQIAVEMDSIGGQVNAFTSKECTCYHARVVDDQIQVAVDVLSDILQNSKIDEVELDKERTVILEEISMTKDHPDDLAHDKISEVYYEGSEYAKPIIGPAENIKRYTRQDIIDYMEKHYYPENIVISVAGKFDEKVMQALLEKYFGNYENKSNKRYKQTCADPFVPEKSFLAIEKDIEQTHIALGFNGVTYDDEQRFAHIIFCNLFGGSMSSRLFQSVREEMGLVYAVYSYLSVNTQCGMFGIYAATGSKTAKTALDVIIKEIEKIKKDGVEQQEFLNSKAQLLGNYKLALESVNARVQSIGKNLLLLDKIESQEEVIEKLERVTIQQVNDVIDYVFDFDKMSAVFVGNIENEAELRKMCE
jgi:predicted Zn-dependent peptidase